MRFISKPSSWKAPIFISTPSQLQEKYWADSKFFHSINHVNVPERWLIFFLLSTRKQGLTPFTPVSEAFEKHIADLSDTLDVYDKILGKQKYLVGDVRRYLLAYI